MLKQKRQLFEFLFVAVDLLVVSIAWILAYWLRFEIDFIPADKGVPPLENYLAMLLFIWIIWAFIFRKFGLYKPMRGQRRSLELWKLIQANALSILILIAVTYLFREKEVPFSRLVFVYFGVIALVATTLQRTVVRHFLREVRRRGYNLRYVLVIGAGRLAGEVASRIRLHPELGIQMLGCVSKDGVSADTDVRLPIIGTYQQLPEIIKKIEVDQVVIALPLEDNAVLHDLMLTLADTMIDVKIVPDLSRFVSVGGSIEEFEGLPVISVQSSPLDEVSYVAKRAFDIVVSTILLLVSFPLWVFLAMLIKVTSRGPIFYSQERVSVDGTRFSILKFRTMTIDAERDGPGWSRKVDCRVTWIGNILRRLSLDELPQLVNVIQGDMSVVGPRPERPIFIKEFRQRVPRYMLRHKVLAGMTGWAQINGWRGDTSIDKRIEHDLYYIENWSLAFDIKIIFLTIFKTIWQPQSGIR